jgi:release factor glutamine methyltransferase
MDKPRSHLHAWPDRTPDPEQLAHYMDLVARRAAGEPVAYLVGQREFWSLPVQVNSDTLIPRPETETLVTCALNVIPADSRMKIADLGTGSGAIALAIAHERPCCHIVASDYSTAALEVAAKNAQRLKLDNIEFVVGQWCETLAGRQFDLIVSNPPYIAQADAHLDSGDVRFEPRSALAAGIDGMDDLTCIARCARNHLDNGAWLMLEHGFDQGEQVHALLVNFDYRDVTGYRDTAGHNRVMTGRK